MSKGINTGIASEFYILSLLYRQGAEAYMTLGNTKAVDIRIVRKDGTTITLDVKAVKSYSSLIVNNVEINDNHYLAFVIYNNKIGHVIYMPEVFIVPSIELPPIIQTFNKEKRVMKGKLLNFKDRWDYIL